MSAIIFLEKALSILFWVLIIFGFDTVHIAVLTLICALLHECGHIAVILILNKRASGIPYGKINGLRISVKDLSYKEEICVAMGGPMINLGFAILVFMLSSASSFGEYMKIFGFINLMTMTSNLLPIRGYDGYKAIEASVMLITNDPMRGARILSGISFTLSILMCFISLYFMLKIGEGYWIFAIFISTVISDIAAKRI